jgi:hypothetical protein
MFQPGNDHLELLFEFGLGTGDGGPWHRLLGDKPDAPAAVLRLGADPNIRDQWFDATRSAGPATSASRS